MKYRRIKIHGQTFITFFTEGKRHLFKCMKGLPEGTKFCYSFTAEHFAIWIVVEHESFDLLKEGQEIPEMPTPELWSLGLPETQPTSQHEDKDNNQKNKKQT